jgi:hypothetical protein
LKACLTAGKGGLTIHPAVCRTGKRHLKASLPGGKAGIPNSTGTAA